MQLYKKYLQLWQSGTVCAGFSPRLPDYAIHFWLDQLERALPKHSARSFLDIGAGDGRLSLLLLHAYSPQGMAIEVQINKKAWAAAFSRYSRFELKEGLLQDIVDELTDKRTFDFVLLAEVFEHIPPADVPAFLKALSNVLSPGGTVFLTTPNRVVQGPAEQSNVWHEKEPYGHYKHYTYAEVAELFKEVGLGVEWHAFECHKAKSVLYNKWFYPISRFDARLLSSAKLPSAIRTVYRYLSAPIIFIFRGLFWSLAQLVYAVEKRYSNEQTGATMMLCIKKA